MTYLTDELRHMKETGSLYSIVADAIDQAELRPERIPYMNQVLEYVKEHCPFPCWRAFEHTASSVKRVNELQEELNYIHIFNNTGNL